MEEFAFRHGDLSRERKLDPESALAWIDGEMARSMQVLQKLKAMAPVARLLHLRIAKKCVEAGRLPAAGTSMRRKPAPATHLARNVDVEHDQVVFGNPVIHD